jgi:2-keto-3-deoxy-6-phosphogluconate aldolase
LDDKFSERILLGMGTLTRIEQFDEAKSAGTRFMVSPHLETKLAGAMVSSG